MNAFQPVNVANGSPGSLLEISSTFPSMVKDLRMVTAFSEISVATNENGDKKDQILMKSK